MGSKRTFVLIPELPSGNYSIVSKPCPQNTFNFEVIRTGILQLQTGNQVDPAFVTLLRFPIFQLNLAPFYQCIICSVPVQSQLYGGFIECGLPVTTSKSCSVVLTWKNFQVGATVISFKPSEFSIISDSLSIICTKRSCHLSLEGTNLSSVAAWKTFVNGSGITFEVF